MDIADLRADVTLGDTVYLNTGASGPSPERVLRAAREEQARHEREWTVDPGPYASAWEAYDRTRERLAAYMGVGEHEVALCGSTGDGISRIANALDWNEGSVVVRTDLEHPAGILPWARLAERGVEVREVPAPGGHLDYDALGEALDGADLFCFNSISWIHGTELDVRRATEAAHDAGALVLVDAVQSPGQARVDPKAWGADFVVAAGHKWLLGVWGAGFCFVDESVLDRVRPRHVGYRSVEDKQAVPLDFHEGAKRLEVGTQSLAPYAALREALDVHDELGLDAVREHVRGLTERLKDGLPADRLVSPREFESGLVAFEVADAETTVERLAERGVVVRALPRPDTVRASLHVFNTEDDVDALLAGLDR
jgi:selenocysteine lyase/cysteine desulfurase